MNLLDAFILAILIFFFIRGIFRGFFREIGSLAGVVLGIVLGSRFHVELARFLGAYLPATRFLPLIGFGIIFIAALVGCNLLALALKAITHKALLGWLDRTLGAGVALLKGVILAYLIIVLLTFFVPSGGLPFVARSALAPWIISSYQAMANMVSPEVYERWKKRFTAEEPSPTTTIRKEKPSPHGSP